MKVTKQKNLAGYGLAPIAWEGVEEALASECQGPYTRWTRSGMTGG